MTQLTTPPSCPPHRPPPSSKGLNHSFLDLNRCAACGKYSAQIEVVESALFKFRMCPSCRGKLNNVRADAADRRLNIAINKTKRRYKKPEAVGEDFSGEEFQAEEFSEEKADD